MTKKRAELLEENLLDVSKRAGNAEVTSRDYIKNKAEAENAALHATAMIKATAAERDEAARERDEATAAAVDAWRERDAVIKDCEARVKAAESKINAKDRDHAEALRHSRTELQDAKSMAKELEDECEKLRARV